MSVENEEERHARMKSVGIICTKYTSLHEHMPFLERQVRYVNTSGPIPAMKYRGQGTKNFPMIKLSTTTVTTKVVATHVLHYICD